MLHCVNTYRGPAGGLERDFVQGQGNGLKLKDERLTLGIRKEFFSVRLVRHWFRLPMDAVNGLSLEVLARLDRAMSNLV